MRSINTLVMTKLGLNCFVFFFFLFYRLLLDSCPSSVLFDRRNHPSSIFDSLSRMFVRLLSARLL